MRRSWDELGVVIVVLLVALPILIWRGVLADRILASAEYAVRTQTGIVVVYPDGRSEHLEDAIMRGSNER